MKKTKHVTLYPAIHSGFCIPSCILRLFSSVLLMVMMQSISHAQSNSVIDGSVSIEENSLNNNSLDGTFTVVIADTTNVSNIEVILGTAPDSPDILSRVFVFDSQSGLTGGYTYSRVGNTVTLGVGSYTEKNTYFGRVRIQENSGQWSLPLQFITN